MYWRWEVLFLGIKDAVFIFTKILIPHKTYCRQHGIRLMMYLDDQKVMASPKDKCIENTKFANDCLAQAGWTLNIKKCEGPSQNIKFLGLMNDSLTMKYYVPTEKMESICNLIIDVLKSKKVHIKILAKLLGKLQFCYKAMGPCVRLLCRSSFYLISKAKSWNSMIVLNDLAKKEFNTLLENFVFYNGFPMRPFLSTNVIDVKLASDASDLGLCVYEILDHNSVLLKRTFSHYESNLSSTHRELLAFYDFYTSKKAECFKNSNIVHYTDNKNCETILTVGSRNFTLQPLVLDIFLSWKALNVKVTVIYVSRDDPIIQYADYESRTFDLHDYSMDFDNFLMITNIFGVFELDCFASSSNKKCCRFYSKFFEKEAEAVNFFAQRIPFCNLFVFPPVHLIIPTLYHLQKFKSFGCLIVPMWMSSYFWTFICNDGKHLNNFVKFVFVFSPRYVSGEHVKSDMFRGVKRFNSLALKFDFNISNAFLSNCKPEFCVQQGCSGCLF